MRWDIYTDCLLKDYDVSQEYQRFQSRKNTKNNLKLSSSPAHDVTSAFKTRCCFSNKKILAEQLKSVRLMSFFCGPWRFRSLPGCHDSAAPLMHLADFLAEGQQHLHL